MSRSNLGSRIRQVLHERDMSQAELARLVGVKQQTISYICTHEGGADSSRYAVRIAEILGVNPGWLQSGRGGKHDPMVRIELEGVELSVSRVPLLKTEDIPGFLKGDKGVVRRQLMTDGDVGNRSFAVEIEGESMRPVFNAGDRVVIDPDKAAEPGDFVCALVGEAITFRKYRSRGTDADGTDLFDLVPLNDDWPTVRSESGAQVLGVMTEHRTYRRK
jgi:SOS-response transcriptional repressor LexA